MPEPKSPARLRLTPHAKALFLRHSASILCDKICEEEKEREEQAKVPFLLRRHHTFCTKLREEEEQQIIPPLSRFFRFLIISKGFLISSQRNKIYRLELKKLDEELYDFELITIQFNYVSIRHIFELNIRNFAGEGPFWRFENLRVSFRNLCRLNRLLKFTHIRIDFDQYTKVRKARLFKRLIKNDLVWAKLNFRFDRWEDFVPYAPQFIQEFSNRLYEIQCGASTLIKSKSTKMNLNYCFIDRLESFGQLKEILKTHSIKKFGICLGSFNSVDWDIESDFFDDFPVCPRIVEVNLENYFWQRKDPDHFEKMLRIVGYFPNIKKLYLVIKGPYNSVFAKKESTSETFVNFALKMLEKIQNFQKRCRPSLEVKIDVYIGGYVHENRETVETSMKLLTNKKIFQTFKLKTPETSWAQDYRFEGKWKDKNFECTFNFDIYSSM